LFSEYSPAELTVNRLELQPFPCYLTGGYQPSADKL